MDKLYRSTSLYVKWLSQKGDACGSDKEKGTPTSCLGRVMTAHGNEFGPDSEFGSCLTGKSCLGSVHARAYLIH